ncbi:MAG: adenine-specific methyltransferase EcoRI family protein [Prevotella sp.]|nr:adenine-specific methyltransferase EcoRI family protein [Prevotella sp.]
MAGRNLDKAKVSKKDEFYTQLVDIENELRHYSEHFRGKTVLCNCDDPYESNFFKYFALKFNALGLKKLIATCYDGSPVQGNELPLFSIDEDGNDKRVAYKVEITEVKDVNGDGVVNLADVQHLLQNDKNVLTLLKGNGDFRSQECIELLKEADIVCTNPPFSLFREYVAQLMKYEKKFLIIGNVNAITYKEIFPLIRDNKLWIGKSIHSGDRKFYVPDDYELKAAGCGIDETGRKFIRVKGVRWFTNLDYKERHENLILYKTFTPEEYPKYDNYDAINVNSTNDIPFDYDDLMGVPITFLDKYSPDQFEIVTLGIGEGNFTPTKKYQKFRDPITKEYISDKRDYLLYVRDDNGKYLTSEGYRLNKVYARIIIKRK